MSEITPLNSYGTGPGFPKLTKSNYGDWVVNMRIRIRTANKDLWPYLNDKLSEEDMKSATAITSTQKEDLSDLIYIMLSTEARNMLSKRIYEDGVELWNEIKGIFTVSGKRQYIKLQREQQNLRYDQFQSIHEYKSAWNRLQNEIEETGVNETRDNKFFIHILQTLPSERFATVMQIWHSQDIESMSSDKAVQMVSDEEKRLEQEEGIDLKRDNIAYKFESKKKDANGKKSYKNSSNASVECYHCHKHGHYKKDCPQLQKKGVQGGERRQGKEHSERDRKDIKDITFTVCERNTSSEVNNHSWVMDTGATTHITGNKALLTDYTQYATPRYGTGPSASFPIEGYGKAVLRCIGDATRTITIQNVKYSPHITVNLLSVDSLLGVAWTMNDGVMKGEKAENLLFYAERKEGLYRLRLEDENGFEAYTFNVQDSERVWHSRLGHPSQKTMSTLHKLVDGVPKLDATQCFCEPCTVAKLQKTISRKASTPVMQKLELVHSDVGTMPVESVGGSKYYVTFTDDKTRYRWTYPLKQKSQVEATFKSWKLRVEAESGFKLQRFRTDGGGEYCSNSMQEYMFEHGIKHERTPAHTPEMNGVSERFNRTLVEKVKSMLHESQLDFAWWGEALATATYLINVLPTAALKDTTPFQEWKEVKPDLAHLKIFGSECWVQVPKANRKKLDNHAVKGVFMGYGDTRNTYRIAINNTVKIYRDVCFKEICPEIGPPYVKPTRNVSTQQKIIEISDNSSEDSISEKEDNDQRLPVVEIPQSGGTWYASEDEDEYHVQEGSEDMERDAPPASSSHHKKVSARHCLGASYEKRITRGAKESPSFMAFTAPDLPETYEEAVSGLNAKDWQIAMDKEMGSILENNTWDEVRNTGQRAVKCKWVYARKADGMFKARLVAKGFSQREGYDYHETFAPVAKVETLRFLLAQIIGLGYKLHQMDVVTAFLHGKLEEEIYMHLPEGYATPGKVAHLLKSLYGLKQSPRQWYAELSKFLLDLGFTRSKADETFYFKLDLWILVYVDDLFIAGELSNITELKEQLASRFKMKDLGKLSLFLGMQLDQQPDCLLLTQSHYLNRVLEKFSMSECNAVATPIPAGTKLEALPLDDSGNAIGVVDHSGYRTLIGSLLYASTHTRPDFAWAMSLLSRFLQAPGDAHWAAAKHLLRYIKGTIHVGLKFRKTNQELQLHSDSDWAGSESRKSTSGYVTVLSGAAITWNATLQRTVALSSMEAEYVALSELVKEAQWLMKLIKELDAVQKGKLHGVPDIPVLCSDNNAALIVAKNPEHHKKAKHINIKHSKVRDEYEAGNIQLARVATKDNAADIFTKALDKGAHERAVTMLGLGRSTK